MVSRFFLNIFSGASPINDYTWCFAHKRLYWGLAPTLTKGILPLESTDKGSKGLPLAGALVKANPYNVPCTVTVVNVRSVC